MASARERTVGAQLPADALQRVLGGQSTGRVFGFLEQIERVVVLGPARSGVSQQQEDVECGSAVVIDAQLVLVHAASIRGSPKADVALA